MSTPFSVLLPTYGGDDPAHLETAIESCFRQTRQPDELLVVEDGPLTSALADVLEEWERRHPETVRRHAIPENRGLGNALRVGVQECANPLVARSDADDVNVETRFETQCQYMANHPDVDIVSGYIDEFADDPEDPVTRRTVPTTHEEIARMARFRSPMNHGTVMFRRRAILEAGNYRPVVRMEDYDLWVRLLCDGAQFANLPQTLVKVRAGEGLVDRRGGLEYARAEVRRQREFHDRGFTSTPVFLFNLATRVPFRFVPDRLRRFVYLTVARDSADTADASGSDS